MKGSQEPRIQVEPSRISTDGADAALLMSAYGCELDPWQQIVLDCWLGKNEERWEKNFNLTLNSASCLIESFSMD